MTTTARELAEQLIDSVIAEYGDEVFVDKGSIGRGLFVKAIVYAIVQAEQRGEARGRESVLSKLPAISEYMDKGLELDAQQRAEDPMAHYVEVSRLHYEWLLAKLKEPT